MSYNLYSTHFVVFGPYQESHVITAGLPAVYVGTDDVSRLRPPPPLPQVRGAPAIAIVGCLSLAVELTVGRQFDSAAALLAHVRKRLAHLVTSRPTAVNLQKAADALLQLAETTATDSDDVNKLRDRSVGSDREGTGEIVSAGGRNLQMGLAEHSENRSEDEDQIRFMTHVKGSMPPSIGHMELLVWMQRADFSEHNRLQIP